MRSFNLKFKTVSFYPAIDKTSIYYRAEDSLNRSKVVGQGIGGLVVHRYGKTYGISHINSGEVLLSGFKTKEAAIVSAKALEELASTEKVNDLLDAMKNNICFSEFKEAAIAIKKQILRSHN